MKTNMNQIKWVRGLGNASYIIGAAFLIASLLVSAIPPAVVSANQPNSQLNCENTNTPSNTPKPPTNTPTDTPKPPTNTPTDTPEPPTNTPTDTLEPPTNTPTDTPELPTNTPTDTSTPTITDTPTSTSTGTVTETFTSTNTPTPTDPPTDTPTNTPSNTPTFTATIDPFDLEFFCTGIRVINQNNFQAPFAWSIDGGPSGIGSAAPFSFVDIETGYYPGIVTLYSSQQLMASGFLPTDCGDNEKTPTPPVITSSTPRPTKTPKSDPTKVFKTLVPKVNTTPEILIPVTGVDLAGGNSTSRMLFNLGLGFIGLGLVLNGISRNRKDLDI